ncbi:GPP34 family phosphoprotein [Micromonospora sp. NPDC093277]|uniref:GOLPH3/VPS74 family protein n=1 Tax=Micromonospora sp. NPDC093277 TaxID=3364291 RepID=UPI0038209773
MSAFTLADELVLLAYDDAGANQLGGLRLGYGLAGAVLLDLALAARAEVVNDRLTVIDPRPVGHPVLDAALASIGAEQKLHKPKDWISRLAKQLPDRVLAGLVEAGVLRRESDRVLGLFPRTRYPSPTGAEPVPETEARRRMHAAVAGDGPVDARTAALIALTRAVGLDRQLFRDLPKGRVKVRLAEIAAGDWASAATKKAIEETQAAVMVAITAAAIASTAAS